MVRGFLHILRLRSENIISTPKDENKKEVSIEDKNNSAESQSQSKSWSIFSTSSHNRKPQTSDVAVGEDECPRCKCFCFTRHHAVIVPEAELKEAAINRFVYSFQREAFIATRDVIASTCSSLFSVLFSHPFDVIKSQYQMLRYPRSTIQARNYRRHKFFYVIRNIYMTKGPKRFYKNIWKSQQESALHVISVFWTYHRVRQFFEENFEIRNEDAANFLAGCFSATIPVLVLYPYQNYSDRREFRLNMQRHFGDYGVQSFHKQLKYWRPFYRGGLAMFVHMSILNGWRFMIYYKIRDHLAHLKTTIDKATDTNPYVTEVDSIINFSNYELLLAGALAAILGDILAHPLDVIRARLAMTPLMRQQFRYEQTCRRFFQCVKSILKNERISAFYAGITPCVMRSTINMALTFAAYEKMREVLRPLFPT